MPHLAVISETGLELPVEAGDTSDVGTGVGRFGAALGPGATIMFTAVVGGGRGEPYDEWPAELPPDGGTRGI